MSSYDVVFDDSVFSALIYTSQPFPEDMDMQPSVSYITYIISLREQHGDIIIFTHFEKGNSEFII